MITVGSVSREEAAALFPFLSKNYRGRRKAIKEFTHLCPDFVFWIYPDGGVFNAKDAHKKNPPPGYEYILNDEPYYGGFFRGRVASNFGPQLIVVYCLESVLMLEKERISQFLLGIEQFPIPIAEDTLVISDNGDIFGNVSDIRNRLHFY